MFDSWKAQPVDPAGKRRLILSAGFSAAGYAGIVVAAVVLGGAAKHVVEDERLDVVFHPAPEPPPPPPPKVEAPSAPLVSAPKHLKRKAADAPPPPPKLPDQVPDAPAPEKDA